jgi:hypothetical protein
VTFDPVPAQQLKPAWLLVCGLVCVLPLQDRDAFQIGLQQPAPGAASFRSALDCMSACDVLDTCAGFTLSLSVPWAKIGSTCRLVFGDPHSQSKRTVSKTDVTRMGLPSDALCPSGYMTAEAGTQCVPITQGQAATFVLTATGSCGVAASQSVQGAVADFLSNPDNAFGERPSGVCGLFRLCRKNCCATVGHRG